MDSHSYRSCFIHLVQPSTNLYNKPFPILMLSWRREGLEVAQTRGGGNWIF